MNYADFALIRFGSGLSPSHDGPATPEALIDSLGQGDGSQQFPVMSTEEVTALYAAYMRGRRGRKNDPALEAEYQKQRERMIQASWLLRRSRLARAVMAPVGFADRLAQFWSSHFSIRGFGAHKIILREAFQEDVIRAHQLGRFADLLRAATLHPAMLGYLDQSSSIGPGSPFASRRGKKSGLNENHARELLELHTLGVGDAYSQADIRQLAELMTGLMVDQDGAFKYAPQRAEPGAETVLGKEYGGAEPPRLDEISAFFDDVAVHPATAHFISRKLARHFCADTPPPELVEAMATRFRDTGGDLTAVYEVMVGHRLARESFGQKVRQPWDFIVAGFRSLDVEGRTLVDMKLSSLRRMVMKPLAAMGQPIIGAPQPEGWPEEEEAWLTPQQLAARIDWALDVPSMKAKDLPPVTAFVRTALGEDRAAEVEPIVRRAESLPEAIGLVIASPQFNRR